MKKSTLLFYSLLIFISSCGNPVKVDVEVDENSPPFRPLEIPLVIQEFNPGLLWRDGVAPQPSLPLQEGNRIWYVDAQAPDGGDGSEGAPFNSFEIVVGRYDERENYIAGLLKGGDHLYLTGEFRKDEGKEKFIIIRSETQLGSPENPTLISSWPGKSRAVFDGESLHRDGILVSSYRAGTSASLRLEGIEIRNFHSRGVYVKDNIQQFEMLNCEIHHTIGNGNLGIGGGLLLQMVNSMAHDYRVSNCLFYSNSFEAEELSNNLGGLSILSEGGAGDGSTVEILNNILYDEHIAIRHKHSGNIITKAHHNLIYNSYSAFYIRAYRLTQIYNNIIYSCDLASFSSRQYIQGHLDAEIRKNTIVDTGKNLRILYRFEPLPPELVVYDYYDFSDNIIYNPELDRVLELGEGDYYPFSIDRWSSARNLYVHGNSNGFLRYQGENYDFDQAMEFMADSTSLSADPGFLDQDQKDFRLSADSPARGMAENGEDIGALPFGSTYVLDLDRMVVQP